MASTLQQDSTPTSVQPVQIVIVDSQIVDLGDDFAHERRAWGALGAEIKLARCVTEGEIVQACGDSEILVYGGLYTPFTADVLAQLPRCRLIARYGIGMDSVDLAAATEQGIVIANAAEFCVPDVADHTAALILALARRVVLLDRFVRAGHWRDAKMQTGPLPRLSTQTVGFVGFGRIARHLARHIGNIFGTFLAYDPYITQAQADAYGVRMVELDELLAESDYVSIHTPLLPETRGSIGAAQLARMKPTAFLINTSRGPVVDEAALIVALQTGQIAGAALDVFDPEPLAVDSPLRSLENVVLSPHMAAYSIQASQDVRAAVLATVADCIQGYLPRHVMNPSVTPRGGLRRREPTQ